jgi:hypothetical protein
MSSISSGINTNNMSAKPAAKRVAKKSDAAPAVATVEVKVAAPAAAAPAKKAAAAPKKTAAVEAPKAVEAAAPVAKAAAPEAQAVAAPVAVASVAQEIASLTTELNTVKESLRKALTALKTIEKRHGQELKEAKKRKRVKKESDGEAKPSRPSVFTTPVLLKDGLAVFLGKEKGTKMSPADVTRAVKIYIDEHKLKGEKHEIHPDARMCEVLGLKAGETLTYKNIQKYLYQQYIKEVKA